MFKETTLYEDDNLRVTGHLVKGNPFLHCKVYDFNKSVLKRIKTIFEDIKLGFYMEGYDEIFTTSPNEKFVKLLGGKHYADLEEEEDNKVYVWELEYY